VTLLKTDFSDGAYLTLCLNTYYGGQSSKPPLMLAGVPFLDFSWVMAPEIAAGQLVIVVIQAGKTALYTLDANKRPFQVAGTRDLLLNIREYHDLTRTHLSVLCDVRSILEQVFSSLSLQEMYYCDYLSEWEWEVKNRVVSVKASFSEILAVCEETLETLPNKNLNQRLVKVLKSLKKTRGKPKYDTYVDWEHYPVRSQTEKPAIG